MEFQCLKFELLDVILKKIPHCNFIVLCPNKNLSVIYFLTSLIFYFREVQETLYLFLLLSHLDSFHLSMKACDTFFFFWGEFLLYALACEKKIRAFMIKFADLIKKKVKWAQ